jgi:hypothetical protein
MNLETFIEKSKRIHGDNFNYSKFEYIGSKNKSILICNRCNTEFLTTTSNNLQGKGCKNCHKIKISVEYSKDMLKVKYPNWNFNFNLYKDRDSIIQYTCEKNHKGKSSYRNLSRYNVCKECNEIELLDKKKNKITNNNLEIIEYISDNLIKCKCVKCGSHGEDSLRDLTRSNYKCKYCILLNESTLLKDGTIKLIKIGDFGDSKNIYLECNKGHKYTQDRNNLLSNRGCNQCRKEKITFSKEYVFSKFSEIHGDLYKYKYDDYISVKSKIEITCRKGHIFFQKVSNHLQGKGCPICRESIGERNISVYLENKSIKFIRQKKFSDCKYISHLPFDFYIPSINTIIEYDGIQHFEPVELFGGLEEFEKTKIKDKIKNEYCSINNIKLYRISYKDIITDTLDLIFN